ncbi:thioredoxin family protein [Luteolibacter sp. LG18]|uniref:thioredoxin family protein n=1 Tax=Luteolibacter sp. LG18 TaxID=2819286 RepID=UPI002B306D62|nr:thioredoxin family protein [Luteolibacter sp. LG18]
MAEVLSTFLLKPGDRAPHFSLPTADGIVTNLDDVLGANGLLVVFACNHCPYVVHLADALGDFAREIESRGVGTVAIVSNDLEKYPQDGPEHMKEFAATHAWDFPYLIDADQKVARAYAAACTPDFFLFDADLNLTYAGQFDDSRPRGGLQPTGGDLGEAVRRMIAGEPPMIRPYPSSGCNIKWKPGNEPTWSGL